MRRQGGTKQARLAAAGRDNFIIEINFRVLSLNAAVKQARWNCAPRNGQMAPQNPERFFIDSLGLVSIYLR